MIAHPSRPLNKTCGGDWSGFVEAWLQKQWVSCCALSPKLTFTFGRKRGQSRKGKPQTRHDISYINNWRPIEKSLFPNHEKLITFKETTRTFWVGSFCRMSPDSKDESQLYSLSIYIYLYVHYIMLYTYHVAKQRWTKESCFCPPALEPTSPFYGPCYIQVFEVQMLTWAETERPIQLGVMGLLEQRQAVGREKVQLNGP